MGFGEMGYWDIDKIPLDREVNKRVFFFISTFFAPAPRCSVPPLRGGFPVSNLPSFHYSMYEAKSQASINTSKFNKLYKFRDV